MAYQFTVPSRCMFGSGALDQCEMTIKEYGKKHLLLQERL